jgi:putative intracellular protease/amidase
MSKTVAILIYPEVEVLDFAGPFEVFSTACRVAIRDGKAAAPPFTVFTAATAHADGFARAARPRKPTCSSFRAAS